MRLFVAAALALSLLAAPAAAQQGRLYEPFPDPLDDSQIGDFLSGSPGGAALGPRLTSERLDRGTFVEGADRELTLPVASSATDRAVPDDDIAPSIAGLPAGLAWALGVALAVLVAALAAPRLMVVPLAVGAAALVAAAFAGADIDPGPPPPVRLAAASEPPPPEFVGIVAEDAFAREGPYRETALDRIDGLGVGLVRQTFDWAQIEREPGRWTLDYHDRWVIDLARRGLRSMPVLFGAPPFRSSRPERGARRGTYPPRRPRDMARFAAVLAERYGPRGSLWRERPDVPRVPITTWQVWNEPSLPAYWASGPDPAEYARLLGAVGGTIERVDPRAEIVTAGLPESRLGVPFRDYLDGLYDAGAKFDTLALHAYARNSSGVVAGLERARALMRDHGDDSPIRLTELGWASDGPRSPFTVGRAGQAERILRTLPELAARREQLGLEAVVWFNWRDAPPFEGGNDFFGLHTGLLEENGRAKPALNAFRRSVRAIR
jgi:hypothetical protein